MSKMEYGTCASVSEGEVNEVYADIMITQEEQELNSDIITDIMVTQEEQELNEAETKALIRRKLEVRNYMEYSSDCEYVDWVNAKE